MEKFMKYCPKCAQETEHFSVFGERAFCTCCDEKAQRLRDEAELAQKKVRLQLDNIAFKASLLLKTGVEEEDILRENPYVNEAMRAKLATFLADFNEVGPKSLLFCGNVGTGKTTTALKVALNLKKRGVPVLYVKGFDLAGISYPNIKRYKLVIFDELHLAVRMYGLKPSDEDRQKLYRFVETLRNHKIKALFITNYSAQQLTACLGAEIVDRVLDVRYNETLTFEGKSFRTISAKEETTC